MKIAYNPKTAAALTTAPANNDITFDLSGLSIYVKGVRFKGTDTTYSVFKKHGSSGGGYDGLVPVPSYNNNSKNRYLREDGTWQQVAVTDQNVLQSETTASQFRPIVFGLTYDTSASNLAKSVTGQVYVTTKMYAQPSTGYLYATKLFSGGKEVLTGHQSLADYVTLKTNQTITGVKTFSTQQKFTVGQGTSPFTVTSTTKVTNLNADLLDGLHSSSFSLVNHTHNYLSPVASIGSSAKTHAEALKDQFTNNKSNIPRNVLINYYSSSYGNGSQYFGYFLNGYDSNPYGGFYVAHYDTPYYVGVSNGTFTQWVLSKVGHTHEGLTFKKPNGTNVTYNGSTAIDLSSGIYYSSNAGNADTVDNYHAGGDDKPWGKLVVVRTDGVAEMGKYIDFHYDNTTGSDYSTRLQCTGNHSNVINLPSASGTLALTSQIPSVTNYYWANIKVASTANTHTNPSFASVTLNHPTDAGLAPRGVLKYYAGRHGWGDYFISDSNGPHISLQPASGGNVYLDSTTIVSGDISLNNIGSIRQLAVNGGIYWNPYVESSSDSSDAASITVLKSGGPSGGTTLRISQQNDSNDTIQFSTNTSASLYHNDKKIATQYNTYVSGGKGYLFNTEITQVNNSTTAGNADTVDNKHASDFLGWSSRQSIGSGSPFQDAVNFFNNLSNLNNGGKMVYNSAGAEYTELFTRRNDSTAHGTILKWGYPDKYIRIIRMVSGKAQSTDWEKISAGYADNADMTDGLHVHGGRNNEANKIVRTDGSGYIQAGWINTTSGDMGTSDINKIYCSNDGYIRYKTPANFFSTLANDSNQLSITIGSQNRKLTVAYASNAQTATYLNIQYCRDDSSPSNKGLWNTIKNGTTNAISNRVRFYTIYNTTTDLGAPVNGHGELLEICSYNSNHWQPQLWFGSGKTGRLYYRNKTYNDNSWGAWRTIAWTSDIPTVTNYYWANVKVSASSSTGTYPTFANMKSTGRVYLDEWLQFNGSAGLYWPNSYGAHFYPNGTSSYGQFTILGNKGGYSGIHFGNTKNYMTVMSTDTHHGLYCDVYGWEFYFNRSNGGVGIRTSSITKNFNVSGQSYLSSNVWIGTTSGNEMLNVGGWVGTTGKTGWYNSTYGGGIWMNDSTYVRIYNGKYLYTTYQYYDVGNQDYTIDHVYASNDKFIRPMAFSTFTTKLLSQFGITTDTRRSKNSSNANIESVTGYVMKNKSFIDIWGFAPTATYRTTKDRPAPYGIGFTDGSDSGGIMPVGDNNALKEIRFYGANSGPTHFTFGRMNWEATSYDSDSSNKFSIYTDIDGTNGNMWTSGSVAIGTSSFDSKLRVYGGIIRIDNSSRYLYVGPKNSSHAHYETNADVSHWFNKRVEVNGHVNPYSNNSFTSGTSDKRWSNVYSYLGNFAGSITITYNSYPGLTIHNNTTSGEASMYIKNNTAGWALGVNPWGVGAGVFAIGQYLGTGSSNWRFKIDNNGYCFTRSYLNLGGGHEKNASSPTYVWGSNNSDTYLRSYQTSSLSVGKAANADYATSAPAMSNWGTTGSTTKIKVKINSATSWMLSFVVTLYQGYKATKIMISGYNYGGNYWHEPEAVLLGDSNGSTSLKVYFGYDSAYNLWVGFDGGSYTGVSISDVTNGYTQISSFKGLFTISNVSSLATLQKTVTATNSVYHADYATYASNYVMTYHHTANNTNYPLIWSNSQATNNRYSQLHTSYDHLYYNPATRRIATGRLELYPVTGNYSEGIRIHPYSNWATIMLCGTDNTGINGTSTNSWGIFNNNGNFYINRATSDGQGTSRLWGRSTGWTIGNINWSSYTLEVGDVLRVQNGIVLGGYTTYGTHYLTGAYGRIFFGNNFHLDSIGRAGSCDMYLQYYQNSTIHFQTNKLLLDSIGRIYPGSTSVRRAGMYGVYDSYKIGHIWSMGAAYMIPDNGANFGNLYGLAYKHTNNTTGGTMAGGHQAVWCDNGSPRSAMGYNGFWAAGGYYKNGSSDSYVLLGGGGHKLESNLSVSHAASAGTSSNVVVNSSDANSTYRMVWHSGNTLYGTNNIYCNPYSDQIYSAGFRHVSYNSASYLLRSDGGAAAFNWSGQGGQPAWLWGGNSQHTYYVYNPSNFNVNSAAKLRVVSCYNGTTNNDLWSTIKSSNNSYLGTSTMYEVYNDGGPTTYGHILDTVTVHSNHWQSQLWMASGKGGRLYYRNKNYNDNTWGSWGTVAWTSDIPTVTNYYWANIKVSASSSTSTSPTFATATMTRGVVGGYNNTSYALSTSSFICQSWIRTTGSTGWYNESYGGGWNMTDTTYIRVYGSKRVYNDNTSQYAFYTSGGMTALGHMYSSSSACSWIAGQNATNAALNIGDAKDTGSYWPWFRQTNTSSKKWFSVGTLGNSLYFIGSATSRTANSYDYGFRMDFSNGYLYGNFSGSLSGNASSATNADKLDGYHASGLFTNLSNSGNNISVTVGGTNKTLTVGYANKSEFVNLVNSSSPTNILMAADKGYTTVKRLTGTVGGATKLMYISAGVPMASSSTVGSSTQGVYLSSGTITKMTYSLNATVNSGNTGRLAYYSSGVAISEMTNTYGEYDRPIYIYQGKPQPVNSMKLGQHGFISGSQVLALDSVTLTEQQVRQNQLFVVGSGKTVTLPTPSDSLVGMVLFFKSATGSSYSVSCASTNLVYHNDPMSTASKTISISSNGSAIFVCMKYSTYRRWVLFWCG